MSKTIQIAGATVLLCIAQLASAEEQKNKACVIESLLDECDYTGHSIYIDQDLLTLDSWTGLNDDRNYTMGFGYSSSGKVHSNTLVAGWRDFLDKHISIHDEYNAIKRTHERSFGVTAFTPNELEQRAPIYGDRPYAGLIYWTNSKMTVYGDNSNVQSRLTLGVLGLDIAKGAQRFLHNQLKVSRHDPLGWDNQISEGGELTAMYTVTNTQLALPKRKVGLWDFDLSYNYGANLGYYTDVSAGFDIRIGSIGSAYYQHDPNPMGTVNKADQFRQPEKVQKDSYFFITYRNRLVGYNQLLQGGFRHSEVTFSGSEIERFLTEAGIGYAHAFSDSFKFTYALHYKSPEYKGPMSREHWFAGIYFQYQ